QEHRHVAVTQGDCQVAGGLMRRDAGRIRLDRADDKVAIVDGADWIRNQIKGQSLPMDVIELDFYHLADNVHKARRAVYGEDAAPQGGGDALGRGQRGGRDGAGGPRPERGMAGVLEVPPPTGSLSPA